MLLYYQNLIFGDVEYQKLLSVYKVEMEVLERNFNLEKDRQKEVFRKKVRVKEVFVILENYV